MWLSTWPCNRQLLEFYHELPEWAWMTGLPIMEVMPCAAHVFLLCSPWGSFCLSIVLSAFIVDSGALCTWEDNNTALKCFMAKNCATIMSIFQVCSFPYASNFNPFNQFFSQHIIFLKSNQRMVFFYRNNIYLML